jgi:phosphopantothenoylcysteine decarboxylase / phosphopantothenate---cysteine ligase
MYGKRILLGISGGIAAYKIAYLIRLLKNQGAEVKCVMTPSATDFISPLVVSTLSQNPVSIEFWNKESGLWTNHVELALWADLYIIAPATANTIAKMAHGICDNLLLACYYSSKSKTIIAPAMDLDMYQHPTFKRNLKQLISDAVLVIPATNGSLASGLEGEGRMEEPENILRFIQVNFPFSAGELSSKKKILITAGPSYEAIDPVRFIGNHSSGKMGFALAEICLAKAWEVTLICGPTNLDLAHPNLTIIPVFSAKEMLLAVQENWKNADIGIFSAAVSDYRPEKMESQKIKKTELDLNLQLLKNPDIISWASENRGAKQFVVGFALETNNALEFALNKLDSKKMDMIVLNSMEDEEAGFKKETNKITILDKNKGKYSFPAKSKREVASDIIDAILKLI